MFPKVILRKRKYCLVSNSWQNQQVLSSFLWFLFLSHVIWDLFSPQKLVGLSVLLWFKLRRAGIFLFESVYSSVCVLRGQGCEWEKDACSLCIYAACMINKGTNTFYFSSTFTASWIILLNNLSPPSGNFLSRIERTLITAEWSRVSPLKMYSRDCWSPVNQHFMFHLITPARTQVLRGVLWEMLEWCDILGNRSGNTDWNCLGIVERVSERRWHLTLILKA